MSGPRCTKRPSTDPRSGFRQRRGVLWGLAAFSTFLLADTCIKSLDGRVPIFEVVFFGILMGFVALPFLKGKGEAWADIARPRRPGLWLLRAVAYLIESLTAVVAFTRLPLSVVYSILFLSPIIATVFSGVVLRETISIRHSLGLVLGFAGVLMVLHPGAISTGLHWDTLGIAAAGLCALAGVADLVILRVASSQEKSLTQLGATMIVPLVVAGVMTLARFQPLSAADVLLIAGYGVGAAVAGMMLIQAAQIATVGQVAPTQYVQMIGAIALGYILFGNAITPPMAGGIAVIMMGGWLVFPRERSGRTQ